jgi:hypothetical protein
MRTPTSRGGRTRQSIHIAAAAAILTLSFASSAGADSQYDVTLDTSSLSGTTAALTFDLLSGGGTQSNTISISNFSTNGLITSSSSSGSVTGSIQGTASLRTPSFFNELQQGVTLGSTISFLLDATTNGPTLGSLNDTFSLFLLDPTASSSLTSTGDPTFSDSLLTFQIDGTPNGNLAVYSGTSPVVGIKVTPVTSSVSAPEIDGTSATSSLTLLFCGLVVLRGRMRAG